MVTKFCLARKRSECHTVVRPKSAWSAELMRFPGKKLLLYMDWMTEKNRLWSSHQSSNISNTSRQTHSNPTALPAANPQKDEFQTFVSSILSKGFTGSPRSFSLASESRQHNNWNLSLSHWSEKIYLLHSRPCLSMIFEFEPPLACPWPVYAHGSAL